MNMFRVLEIVFYVDEIPIIHIGFKVSYYYKLKIKYSIGGSHVDFLKKINNSLVGYSYRLVSWVSKLNN
jgi:hypothetical protein